MNDPWVGIVCEACDLKRAQPVQYERFIASMKVYAERTVAEFVAAERGKLELAQGRTQILVELVDRLENCFALEGKYRKRT